MERMNGVMNVREAELKEVIKINHEEIAYWKNKANNAETELDQVKRENERLEEENRKLREELSAYDREYFDEDKKAENIFMEDDTYVYDAKQVRDVC